MKRTTNGSDLVVSLQRTPYVRTLIVLGAFAVLLAYVILVEVKREPQSDRKATPTPWPVLGHSIDDLKAIHITDGKRTLRLASEFAQRSETEVAEDSEWHITKAAGVTQTAGATKAWYITESSAGPGSVGNQWLHADPNAIRFPMNELIRLEARLVVLEQVSDPAAYSLDVPALTLTIETQFGSEERIYVGRETPDGTAFYVQREGDPRLYIVSHYKLEFFFEWLLDPPYQPTPTPEPTPTSTTKNPSAAPQMGGPRPHSVGFVFRGTSDQKALPKVRG